MCTFNLVHLGATCHQSVCSWFIYIQLSPQYVYWYGSFRHQLSIVCPWFILWLAINKVFTIHMVLLVPVFAARPIYTERGIYRESSFCSFLFIQFHYSGID